MRNLLGALALLIVSPLSWAVSPYIYGDRVAAKDDLNAAMGQVEAKLTKAGSRSSPGTPPRVFPTTAW